MFGALNTEIRLPKNISFRPIYLWTLEGLSLIVPPFLQNVCWRPAYIVKHDGGLSAPNDISIVERSLFGKHRFAETNGTEIDLPVYTKVPKNKVFVTRADFPRAARQDLGSAIRLRYEELSPLALERSDFCYRERPTATNDRVSVDIAIVSHETLAEIKTRAPKHRLNKIGAFLNKDGRFEYFFDAEKPEDNISNISRKALGFTFLLASIFALLGSIDFYLAKRLEILEKYEAELIAEIRSSRETDALLREIDMSKENVTGSISIGDATAVFDNWFSTIPDGFLVETTQVEPTGFTLTGYAPDTQKDWTPATGAITFSSINRPGFSTFSWTGDTEASK